MSDSWLRSTTRTIAAGGLGTVLSLGRGTSACVAALPPGSAEHVVQLEPDPTQALHLQKQYGNAVCVLPIAFGEHSGTTQLHQFSMPFLSALRPATGLMELFPGLHSIGTLEVNAQSADVLMNQVALADGASHVLALGAPGEELSAIEQLAGLGVLTRFEHIITPVPRFPLYEGAAEGHRICEILKTHGFRVESQDMSDPDRGVAWLQQDRSWLALTTAHTTSVAEIKTLRAALVDAQNTYEAEAEALRTRLKEVQSQTDQMQADLVAARAETEALQCALTAERKERAEELTLPPQPHNTKLTDEMARLEAQIHLLQSILVMESLS